MDYSVFTYYLSIFCIAYFGWKIYGYFFRSEDSTVVEGKLSSDDVLEWDENTEQPFVPVTIIREQGQYYAWFANNDVFAGQGKSLAQVREAAYEAIFKQMGLTVKFDREK